MQNVLFQLSNFRLRPRHQPAWQQQMYLFQPGSQSAGEDMSSMSLPMDKLDEMERWGNLKDSPN